jgi:hypothetical protein
MIPASMQGGHVPYVLILGQLLGGGSSGSGRTTQKAGDQFEFRVGVSRSDLAHRGVHPGQEAVHLGVVSAQGADDDRTTGG